jgi:homospermidine synthase
MPRDVPVDELVVMAPSAEKATIHVMRVTAGDVDVREVVEVDKRYLAPVPQFELDNTPVTPLDIPQPLLPG